jgi:23S rRNA (cytosine1962-C5)-methyltransferase
MRDLEGLPSYVECVNGEAPDSIRLEENGCQFEVAPQSGQKTGWYFDHRLNRLRAQAYAKGCRVLDVFSYVGAWGIQAALAGAKDVMCVDSSAAALDGVMRNAELNGLTEKVATLEGDVFEALKALRAERERFDMVILDPPAFIKRKKDLKEGEIAYQRVNQMAMQLLNKDGILVSASCSYHLQRSRLREIIAAAARHVDRGAQILEQGHLGPDHPVHPAMPETDYLKAFITRLTLR